MLIRCVACNKLIYSDDALEEDTCPACGSTNTEHIAMGFIFDQTVTTPDRPGGATQQRDAPDTIRGKA
ncbi:hypothetical protein CBA19CS22_33620 [Caballeronia novacaledonica]|jgi:phage FluMu protein Com|uniref:Uncharacterized protein n=1 Tax=Caballeronia novacaledonica TaxID=1544861 RepID=A0ACB5R2M5_9BURK|nr:MULTISPECIES: hypothetical protein [unclassified Caballeronia]KAK47997.1 hypothetical protein BG58_38345 [Caballeronia jiangsuensis]MBC8639863.1 hypothetical protein [Caballeronia sp. EK]MDR5744481.1 hypothetical protein [Caballeronia sp. LZ029]GJH21588.1 hypothetical protein CBA19CS22_33620 [Caballeronia novacaledonica]